MAASQSSLLSPCCSSKAGGSSEKAPDSFMYVFGKVAMDFRLVFHVLKNGLVARSLGVTWRSGFARWS